MSGAESSDDENVEECQARRQTAKVRVRKYIAAKASSSKLGRELIQKGLGEKGGELIDLLQEVMEKFAKQNPDKGLDPEKMRKYLFKIVVKCAVFFDNGILEESSFNDVSVVAGTFAWKLIDHCELSMVYYEPNLLQELLGTIYTGMCDILKPVVTGKSLDRLEYLHRNLSPELFEYLLREEVNTQTRADISARMLKVVEDRNIRRPAADKIEKDTIC